MGRCQHCGTKNVETQPMEVANNWLQVCAVCYSKLQKGRAEYKEMKAKGENHERKSKAEYDERKAREAIQRKNV